MKIINSLLLIVLVSFFATASPTDEGPIKVEVKKENGKWQIYRGGEPYYIKGAGGHVRMDIVEKIGGNSVRTWSADGAKEILDEAHSRGLTVTMGLWAGHERHGMDYNSQWAVDGQFEKFKEYVIQLKDHPALLMWGIGNEVDLFYTNHRVWDAIQDIAKMVHEIDPNHPTSTITAGFDIAEAQMIMERAPDIDVYGVNTYGDIGNVSRAIRQSGWDGPYMITEWGPTGHWEIAKTTWGVPIEQSSAEKADVYQQRYEEHILADDEMCVGSYVFVWGQKQETTATWYGMFLESGEKTEVIDVMEYVWSGKWPENRTPRLKSLKVDGKGKYDNVELSPGKEYEAIIDVKDADGDPLEYRWEFVPESTDIKAGGDKEAKPEPVQGLIKTESENKITFKAPRLKGAYRLFVYVLDGQDHSAYANLPFYVK